MRKGFLGSLAILLLGAGLGLAQSTPPAAPASSDLPSFLSNTNPITGECAAPQCPADGCCPACPTCPPCQVWPGRFWGTAEYLLWWTRSDHQPPLATTGPATFPVGFLGNPGTVIIAGNSSVNQGLFTGGRFSAGYWFDDCQTWGIMGSYFFLGQNNTSDNLSSNQFPVLARPFTNVNTGGQFSEFAAFPGISTGNINITNSSRLWGIGPNFVCTACCGCWYRLNLLGGFQYVDLQESTNITESATFLPTAPFPGLAGNTYIATDSFGTRNQFYGGNVGAAAWFWRGAWFTNIFGMLGLGDTHETITINGSQLAITPTGTQAYQGGLLALPSNSGRFTHDTFAVLPQVNFNVGRMLGRHVAVFMGYSFLYWSRVVRPGDQIDTSLNVNQIPNFGVVGAPAPNSPIVPFKQTGFWAQGINFGVGVFF